MTLTRIPGDSPFEAQIGYCRAVRAGDWVHVAGTTGQGADVITQCRDALSKIHDALRTARADWPDVVRVTYMLPDRADFPPCWPILRETFGAHPPAATMIVCDLIAPRFKIEIEVTAYAPAG